MRTSIALLSPFLAALSIAASAAPATYQPPRHADGRPNFEGLWTNRNSTPLVRPPGYTQLFISEAEAREIDAKRLGGEEDPGPGDPTETNDERRIERVGGMLRSSIIVDPPDGQLPTTAEAGKRIESFRAGILTTMDGPEQRPLPERCIGTLAAFPPMLSIPASNVHQIVQTVDAVLLFAEPMHDARIIRMNAQHAHPAVTSWLGDSIGWWEGDTLVVETKFFTPSGRVRTSPLGDYLVSPRTVVTERFTRVAHEELNYRFTVEDPTWYVHPWRGESHFTLTAEPMLEFACHEGNYSLRFILETARTLEATAEPTTAAERSPR
jgi:hypothetical protein